MEQGHAVGASAETHVNTCARGGNEALLSDVLSYPLLNILSDLGHRGVYLREFWLQKYKKKRESFVIWKKLTIFATIFARK